MHTQQGACLSGSNFFPLTEKASHSPACFSMKTTSWAGAIRAKLILRRQCLHSCDLLPTPVLASVKSWWRGLLVNLHAPTPFGQIGQGYLRGDLCAGICYTSGNHGSIWANFCSPSKTTKLVQIWTGLPERAPKKCSFWKNQLSTWTLTNF